MEPGNTEHYLEQLNLTELMEQLNRCFSSAFLADFSLEQLFSDILSGNGKEALQLLGRQIAGSVGQEFSGMRQILSVLLLLGILSVLVSCLMGSFENQQVAQIAHDMFFLLVLTVLLKVFSAVYRITGSTLETLKQFSHLTLPALCLSLGPAAGSVTAAGYYELTLGFIFLIERFLSGFCLLLLPLWMLLVVLSGIWEEGRLSAMMELVSDFLFLPSDGSFAPTKRNFGSEKSGCALPSSSQKSNHSSWKVQFSGSMGSFWISLLKDASPSEMRMTMRS